jgi:lysophospholipase L1-like esterase
MTTSATAERMRRLLSLLTVLIAAALALPQFAGANEGTTYYLSLGDSLAVGVQPTGPPPFYETDEGYTDQLYAALAADEPTLKHVKLGCGGESTTSMLEGSQLPWVAASCGPPAFYQHRYPHKTQLAEAVSFLHAHRGFVRLVTIDIGANDVLGPGGTGEIVESLPVILAELRAAAGLEVPIVGMNYYSPFSAVVWAETHDLAALQAQVNEAVAFNDLLESFYTAAGDPYADVESAFQVTDLTLVGGTPLNVVRECQWTWICTAGDVHANTEGYDVIAQAFLDVL